MSKLGVLRSAFLNAGYRVSLSHANRYAIKTDAPNDVVWDIMRAYEKEHPSNPQNRSPVSQAILGRSDSFSDVKVSFQEHADAEPASRSAKLLRFQHNPPNWGPKNKAKLVQRNNEDKGEVELQDKRQRNQGKYSKRAKLEVQKLTNILWMHFYTQHLVQTFWDLLHRFLIFISIHYVSREKRISLF